MTKPPVVRFASAALIAVLASACGPSASTREPVAAGPTGSRLPPVSSAPSIILSSPTAGASPAPTVAEATDPTAASDPSAERPTLEVGAMLVTVSDRVRVRSRPSTGDESTRYEPVLPLDTELHALEGPVRGDGYWWYRVELVDRSQHLFGGIREGWVAVADHDGAPWVDTRVDVTPGSPAPPTVSGWPTVRRGSTILSGGAVLDTPTGVFVPIEIHGLLPGTEVTIDIEGDYEVEWLCGGGPEGELGAGAIGAGTTSGSASARFTLRVGDDGALDGDVAVPELTAEPPSAPCPPDYPGPKSTVARRWDDLRVRDIQRSLELTPPPFVSADTF